MKDKKKYFDWSEEKNEILKQKRNISFEEILIAIQNGNLLDRVKHPNSEKFPKQFIFHVQLENYVYSVPFIEEENKIFLKKIYPNRTATKLYLGEKNG